MFFFERRRFIQPLNLDIRSHNVFMTFTFLLFLFGFPFLTIIVGALAVTLYQYKMYRSITHTQKRYTPEAGDILLFFSHNSTDLSTWVIWDGILTLHTNVPATHYAVMIDEAHFVEVRHPDMLRYDNITKCEIRGFPRLAKLKHIHKDWTAGEIMIIKTGQTVDESTRDSILRDLMTTSYWASGGCLGFVNHVYRKIDPTCPFFMSTEGILKHSKNAKIGHADV